MDINGSDEMSRRIRAFDWSVTPLGPRETWPASLLTALSILLGSRTPMQLLWGREYIHFYNEAYIPIAADKHPQALGSPSAAVWPEVWDTVNPMLDQVVSSGQAILADDLLLLLNRRGYLEEGYFSFSYGPIRTPHGVVSGIFIAVTETTRQVLRERRLRAINDLADTLATNAEAARLPDDVAAAMDRTAIDVPFTLSYLLAGDGGSARLIMARPLPPNHPAAPAQIVLTDSEAPWPLAEALATRRPVQVDGLTSRHGPLPGGPWEVAPEQALVLPIISPTSLLVIGFLVVGINPRLRLDDDYRDFLERLAAQLGIAAARALAESETQAMIRARDDFLSIAAHELKNPLTPIIGKLQLLQRRLDAVVSDRDRESLRTVIGEARRLNGMIDSLLDISRLRSGQLSVDRASIDLSALASQIAEEIGPTLNNHSIMVEGPPNGVIITGDEMRLGQVVRNLLSNAIKYSPEGGPVMLRVGSDGARAMLAVSDNGIGVPSEALPRLFEQYYRVESGEGTVSGVGVGLYVASEIVRLHGGQISVASTPGLGSTFIVRLPVSG